MLMMLRKSMALMYWCRPGMLSEAVRSRKRGGNVKEESRKRKKSAGGNSQHRGEVFDKRSDRAKRAGEWQTERSSAGKRKDEAIPGPVTCARFSSACIIPQIAVEATLHHPTVFLQLIAIHCTVLLNILLLLFLSLYSLCNS